MTLPLYQYVTTETDIGQQVGLGNGIAIPLDGSGPFSITGWFRLHALANEASLLSRGSELVIGLAGSSLYAQMAGQLGPVTSSAPIVVNQWHFFALTADLVSGSGLITLYLDGAQVGQVSVNGAGMPSSGANYLLGGAISADFLAIGFYAAVLPPNECLPDWCELSLPPLMPLPPGIPTPPQPLLTPAADFDLASVPPVDLTGANQVTLLEGAHQSIVAQALSLYGSWVAPAAADGLDPASGNAFSVQAWILPYAPTPEEGSPTLTILSNGAKGAAAAFAFTLTYDASHDELILGATWSANTPFTVTSKQPLAPGRWVNVAVTYDGTTLTLYADGSAVGAGAPGSVPAAGLPSVLIGATADNVAAGGLGDLFKGGIQALGVWTSCLAPADIANYMAQEPTGQPNCAGYFDFANIDLSNQVTGRPIQLFETADILEMEAPASGSTRIGAIKSPADTAVSPFQELVRRAAMLDRTAIEAPVISLPDGRNPQLLIDAFEKRLVNITPSLASSLRDHYRRNLLKGLALHASNQGPVPGTFTHSRDEDEWVIWHHGRSGPEEVLRLSVNDVDKCTAWYISLIATAIGVLLSALGVGYAGGKIATGVTMQVLANEVAIVAALRVVLQEAIATETFIKIVRTFYSCANLATVISSGIVGVSWWSFSWTVANLLLQIVAIWVTGGWWTLFIIGQLAISLGQLFTIMNERPENC